MSNQSYIVGAGDTLGRIAQKFGVSPHSIAKDSHVTNINNIYIGQKLTIGSTQRKAITSIISSQSDNDPHKKTWDKYTNARILKLHPNIRDKAFAFINEVEKNTVSS